MPSRQSISIAKAAKEFAETAVKLLEFPTPVKVKNPAAVALGKLGGSKGGKARAANLSPEERKAIAQLAAKARWAKEKVIV